MENREFKVREVTLTLLESKTDEETRKSRGVHEPVYTGRMVLGPTVGKSFHFYRDDYQEMFTSTVKNIEYKASDELVLTTRNSVYSLKLGKVLND